MRGCDRLDSTNLKYMAQKKTSEVDYSMQEKIMALYELQKIDSQIDEINKVKGELPLEVQDLEDEIEGLKTRIENINGEIDEFNSLTKQRKREVDQSECPELEIELAEKRLKEYSAAVKSKKAQLEDAEGVVTERESDLNAKKAELESIEAETADQVASLTAKAEKAKTKIDERLLSAYDRIRVVTVKRDACGGCFNRIPPQRQSDIRQGKKLIVCEYCGRILVADNDESNE